MIVGLGLDLVEVKRIRAVYRRHPDRFLRRILTPAEQEYVSRFADPAERLAGRWAAKEAALKALGTGLAAGIGWHDVEIRRDQRGKPLLQLHAAAAERAAALGADLFHVTITHDAGTAAAQVIMERSTAQESASVSESGSGK